MSFNISTRLNNLQYQINQKSSNPLTSDLNCAGFDIDNCGTLHYTTLDPPVGGSAQNLDETLTAGNSAGNMSIIDLSAVVLSDVDGVNNDIIISQLPGLGGRINIYQDGDVIDPFASSATVALGSIIASSNITAGGNLNVGGATFPSTATIDGSLVIVNDGPPTGQTILSANTSNELLVSNGITTPGNITCNTLNYTTLNPPVGGSPQNIQQVLTTGNNAGGLIISNLGSPSASTDSVNKSYVDNRGYPPYTLYYPVGSGGVGVINIPNDPVNYTVLWTSPAIATSGRNARVNIQFSNAGNGGSLYTNVLESVILVSDNNFAGPFVPTDIIPYNQIPPANGFFWSPSFNGWFNIDGTTYPTNIYVRIAARQSLLGGGYNFAGGDAILTVYPL